MSGISFESDHSHCKARAKFAQFAKQAEIRAKTGYLQGSPTESEACWRDIFVTPRRHRETQNKLPIIWISGRIDTTCRRVPQLSRTQDKTTETVTADTTEKDRAAPPAQYLDRPRPYPVRGPGFQRTRPAASDFCHLPSDFCSLTSALGPSRAPSFAPLRSATMPNAEHRKTRPTADVNPWEKTTCANPAAFSPDRRSPSRRHRAPKRWREAEHRRSTRYRSPTR